MTVMMSVTSEQLGLTRSAEEVIMSIEKSPAHKELRNIWSVDRKAFEAQKWDQEEEARQLRAEVYHVTSMALIFQGVIFTAISQTNLLSCSLVWSPICLSAIVGLVSMIAVADKIYELGIVKNEINRTDANINALVSMLDRLDKEGAGQATLSTCGERTAMDEAGNDGFGTWRPESSSKEETSGGAATFHATGSREPRRPARAPA